MANLHPFAKPLITRLRPLGRAFGRATLRPLVRWRPLDRPEEGFSIILGVPWNLRHLLSVNLRFVARTDTRDLRKLFIVVDRRPRAERGELERQTEREFPELPIEWVWYPRVSGWLIERMNISTFYNAMNTVLALGRCRTRYAVLHDFDLYPTQADHFTSIVGSMRDRNLSFSGHELTHFQGLTDEDLQIGTWTLGVDVQRLRSRFRPIDCFHRYIVLRGKRISIDPFAWVQFKTPDRALTGRRPEETFCHIQNLCSTHLRWLKGGWTSIAWRLHCLWYLEYLAGRHDRLEEICAAMDAATVPEIVIDGRVASFRSVHVSCVEVLRADVTSMESLLHGSVRSEVAKFLDSTERFFDRTIADSQALPVDPSCRVRQSRASAASRRGQQQ